VKATLTAETNSARDEDRLPAVNGGNGGSAPWTRRAFLAGTARLFGAAGLTRVGLIGAGSAGALAACGSSRGAGPGRGGEETLAPFFATGTMEMPVLRSGVEQRMPWGIADREGVPMTELPESATVTIRDVQDRPVGDALTVGRHGDGTPFPYFPVRTTLPQAGTYTVAIDYRGKRLEGQVVVAAPEQIALVQPGERAIPVLTPTPADHRGVEPICTRDPVCPFHAVTLSDALGSGRPTALLVSSPAYCQTNVCGPVLELLIGEGSNRPLNVVHAEVYANAAATGDVLKADLSETTKMYKLSFEPSLLVMDAKGIVVDRLDFVFDRAELRASLDKIG
jgi:hypothetical protein